MKEGFKKLIFYIFFIALGTICAEVLSLNSIKAIWNPLSFLVYGLLYVFFINYLFEKKITDWKTIYLFGMLVGFITEAYFAKVVFFGWPDNNFIFYGFAIKEILILIFFIHSIVFMLSVFIARNFFGFPFNVRQNKLSKLIFLLPLYPLIWSGTVRTQLNVSLIIDSLITLIIFIVITCLFYKFGKVKNVILSKKAKIILGLLFLVFYTYSFFRVPIYGKNYVDTPEMIPLLISFIFVAFIFSLIWLRTRKLKSVQQIEYSVIFSLKKTLAYFVYFFILTIGLIFALFQFKAYFVGAQTIILLLGTVSGVAFFIYVLFNTFSCFARRFWDGSWRSH